MKYTILLLTTLLPALAFGGNTLGSKCDRHWFNMGQCTNGTPEQLEKAPITNTSSSTSSSETVVNITTVEPGGPPPVTLEMEETTIYPEVAMAVPPSIAQGCSVSVAGQGTSGGLSSSFPDASCQAMFIASGAWQKYLHFLENARKADVTRLAQAKKYTAAKVEFDAGLLKGSGSGEINKRAVKEHATRLTQLEQLVAGLYDRALFQLDLSQRYDIKASRIVARESLTGEIGGHVARIIPIGAVLKAFNRGD